MAIDFSLFGVSPNNPLCIPQFSRSGLCIAHTDYLSFYIADGQRPRQQAE